MDSANKKLDQRAPAEPSIVEKLQKASVHLGYEIWMLESTAQALATEQIRHNALLEAFVIHARVLMDFMYDDKPWPDDVVAAKFFDAPEQWTGVRKRLTELSEELQKVNGRAGKEVAHLTFARQEIAAEMKIWQYGKIAAELSALFGDFIKQVPKNKLSPTWNQIPRT